MNINKIFINFSKRAEKIDRKTLVESFVDVGPLQTLLSTVDNQILYGRRGTGKTHALVYLSEAVKNTGDLSTYVDMRNIGSTGGIYSDHSLPLVRQAKLGASCRVTCPPWAGSPCGVRSNQPPLLSVAPVAEPEEEKSMPFW